MELLEILRICFSLVAFAADFLRLEDPVTLWYLAIGLFLISSLFKRSKDQKSRILDLEKDVIELKKTVELLGQRQDFQKVFVVEQEKRHTENQHWLTALTLETKRKSWFRS